MTQLLCKRCQTLVTPIIDENFKRDDGKIATKATCPHCETFLRFLPRNDRTDFTFHFGKYRGKLVSKMTTTNEINYLTWCLSNVKELKPWQKDLIKKQITKYQ